MSATLSLIDAAKRGDLEEVTRLLQNGANINQQDRVSEDVFLLSFRVYYDCYGQIGYAAIHYAARGRKNEVLKYLVTAGADKDIVTNVSFMSCVSEFFYCQTYLWSHNLILYFVSSSHEV